MTLSEITARIDRLLRPGLAKLPPDISISIYSQGRKLFLQRLSSETRKLSYIPPDHEKIRLWDMDFNSSLFNAAGMFKQGEGYYLCASQGAGAYLAGTTTHRKREGNYYKGIKHPFAPYPNSGSASNWMGLPNKGHDYVAAKLSDYSKIPGCPIGASISSDPDLSGTEALKGIIAGLGAYERAGVDFIELNESCPNVQHENDANDLEKLAERLEYISNKYLKIRSRLMPVIVKFSNDTDPGVIPELLDILTTLEYDGANFGNTSKDYATHRNKIDQNDIKIFDYFIDTFGGGISGKSLKECSLSLSAKAIGYLEKKSPGREFHLIRTGGIENHKDLIESAKAGINLNQWFSGYFEGFASYGHNVYKHIFEPY